MGEIIEFLRSETGKRENLIEDFLKFSSGRKSGINKVELKEIIQNLHQVYSSIERLREKHSTWTMISSDKLYDCIKALISLDCLPESNDNIGLPKGSGYATIAGYLYVFHVIQIHSHGICHILEDERNIDESVYRVFNSIQDDLAIRRVFLDKVRAEISIDDSTEVAAGINFAFAEIQKRLCGKTIVK